PLHVHADGTELLADPGVERGERLRVVRGPEWIGVLARRAEEELSGADAPLFLVQFQKRFDHAGAPPAAAGRLDAAEELRVRGEPRGGTPVGAELPDGVAAIGVAADAVRADVEPSEAAGQPRRRPGHPRLAPGQKSIDDEALLGARVERGSEDEKNERATHQNR